MKLGIIGAGTIVPGFIAACLETKQVHIQSICGLETDLNRMNELALQYGIDQVLTDYQELLDSDCDTVYIAVPNHLHYMFTKKAIMHKKHVIVEKPFASNRHEAKELVKVAKANQVILFEAISNLYLPNYAKTKELLPTLGDIKIVQLNYSQYSRRYDQFKQGIILPVFDSNKAGGALMDINVYNIHFIVGLFGKPNNVIYKANIERHIDTSGVLVLEYPDFCCVAVGAKDCQAPISINIQGDKGYIHSDSPANVYQEFVHVTHQQSSYSLNEQHSRLFYEIEAFIQLLENQDYHKANQMNQHTLMVMEILDEARSQAGVKV